MGAESVDPQGRRLKTWKEIATFLGRDERTAKRWEASRGLPVRRIPGHGHASVFAYAHELQAWLDAPAKARNEPADSAVAATKPKHASPVAIATLALLVLATAATALFWGGDFPIAQKPAGAHGSGTHDSLAVAHYRSGLHEWQTRSPSGLVRAVADFNAAIRRDPNYAEAYVGLADTYNLLREFTLMSDDQAYAKARAAAARAVQIDPSLASGYAALAFVDFYWRRDVPAARKEFAHALALDPHEANTHHWYATSLMTLGEFAAARQEIDKAADLDPESSAILADKAFIEFHSGQRDQAVRLLKQIEADQPLFASPHRYLADIALARGENQGYLAEMTAFAKARHDAQGLAVVADGMEGLSTGGHMGMLHGILAARLKLYAQGRQSAYSIAESYALLGDRKNAFAYLAIAVSQQEPDIIGIRIDPPFDSFRGTAEFGRLLQTSTRIRP